MPAKGGTVTTQTPFRHKVYVEGSQPGVAVPFTEVVQSGGEPGIRLYDTSGPGSDPEVGLPPLRRPWILGRDDVEEYDGRPVDARDDGRSAAAGRVGEAWRGERRRPLRARGGGAVTPIHYARRGD